MRYDLRLISAWDALCAQEEALSLGGSALSRNACVLARALYKGKRRAFRDGKALLQAMSGQTVACWMREYDRLCRLGAEHWDALRRDSRGRLRWKVMRALGLFPKDMTERQLMTCVMHMALDSEEELARLCPDCRQTLSHDACPVCGGAAMTVNPNFDPKRFEELKKHGSLDMDHDPAGA